MDDLDFIFKLNKRLKDQNLDDVYINVNGDFSSRGLSQDTSVNKKKLQDKNLKQLRFQNREFYQKLI